MVREYLDTQKDIKYRAGDGNEGGGGATVVIFK
jgi:dsDNA-specific endonuclease/ATPase MutS2